MSNIQYAFISRSRVPSRSQLQSSIDGLGFDLKLHPEYTPFEDSGFLPFTLNGEEGAGFEIQYQLASEIIGDDPSLGEAAAGRDYCISMAWHGSMKDLACVLIVSCALIKDYESVVSYEGEPPEPLENLLSEIPKVLIDAQQQEARPKSHPLDVHKKRPWWKVW
jgi:hypothetical protein